MIVRQITAELRQCTSALNDREALLDACKAAAHSVGATIVGEGSARYQPHGDTVVVFLAESHIMITTWPEMDLALVDILLCNPEMDVDACIDVIKSRLSPDGQLHVDHTDRVIAADRTQPA